MSFGLASILPNIEVGGLNGTGFLFGAGTSCEAGYPMMPQLTREVVAGLDSSQRELLDDSLASAGHSYDATKAEPNIEQIADLVIAHLTNTGDTRFAQLETRIRELILERILAVVSPDIKHHCRFFEALKKRAFGQPCCVWIFTTNYDLLFEVAAARCGVRVENGFCGTVERFFNPEHLKSCSGSHDGKRFHEGAELTIKLVKLHGSVSWTVEDAKIYERHPSAILPTEKRVIILPRRKKVMDTLVPPYDSLFTQTSKVLGAECKYLVSCGFSFGDEHINSQILLPIMEAKACRLFALSRYETDGLASFKPLPNFFGGFETHLHQSRNKVPGTTDYWKFSSFVSLFE